MTNTDDDIQGATYKLDVAVTTGTACSWQDCGCGCENEEECHGAVDEDSQK